MKTDGAKPGEWLTIARSPYFVVEKGVIDGPAKLSTTPESFVILVVADGAGTLRWDGGEQQVKAGECFLVPANLGAYELDGAMTVIRSNVP